MHGVVGVFGFGGAHVLGGVHVSRDQGAGVRVGSPHDGTVRSGRLVLCQLHSLREGRHQALFSEMLGRDARGVSCSFLKG